MLLQSSLDFSALIPTHEFTPRYNRHPGNQQILEENREHFSKQAKLVLRHLANGEKVSGEMMHKLYGMQDFRPRIAQIRKVFELIPSKVTGGHGAKQWEMKEEDRPRAIEMLKEMKA